MSIMQTQAINEISNSVQQVPYRAAVQKKLNPPKKKIVMDTWIAVIASYQEMKQ